MYVFREAAFFECFQRGRSCFNVALATERTKTTSLDPSLGKIRVADVIATLTKISKNGQNINNTKMYKILGKYWSG